MALLLSVRVDGDLIEAGGLLVILEENHTEETLLSNVVIDLEVNKEGTLTIFIGEVEVAHIKDHGAQLSSQGAKGKSVLSELVGQGLLILAELFLGLWVEVE